MPTPKKGYWLDGKQLVSVTTVLWPYNDGGSEGLIQWGVNLLLEWMAEYIEKHGAITSMENVPRKLHVEVKERAGAIGTMAHAAIEWWAQGGNFVFAGDPEITEPAKIAYGAFLKWIEKNNFKITHCEERLTSRLYRYGGTLDVAGLQGNHRALGDWKTSNWLKKVNVLQLAAYRQLWNENYSSDPILGGCNLIRFDKTTGVFQHMFYTDEVLDEAFKHFLHLLEVYRGIQKIKI